MAALVQSLTILSFSLHRGSIWKLASWQV